MSDVYYPTGTNQVNGSVAPGATLTGSLEYITITTTVDIRVASAGSATSQSCLDKLIEVVATRGQPVITGTPYLSAGNYVLEVAIEHFGAWSLMASPYDLVSMIVASQHSGMGFTAANTAVAFTTTL